MTSSSPTPRGCGDLTPHPAHTTERGHAPWHHCPGVPNLAEPAAGRCGDRMVPLVDIRPVPVCALPAGHAGWHRSDTGAEWTLLREEADRDVDAARDARVRADERRRVAEQLAAIFEKRAEEERRQPGNWALANDWDIAAQTCEDYATAPAERVHDAPTDTAGTPECVCDLIDVSVGQDIQFVRGQSNGCPLHPHPRAADIAEAKRRAREAP